MGTGRKGPSAPVELSESWQKASFRLPIRQIVTCSPRPQRV